MYLTNEHQVGGKSISGSPEDLSYIVKYNWESANHMREAIKIMLSARLECRDNVMHARDDHSLSAEFFEVQLRLASNPQAGSEVLDYLSKTGDKRVCERLAANPRTPETALHRFLNHPDFEVRAELSENLSCPITVLYRLATDKHPDVRLRMAENPHLPFSILEELSQDENPYVADRAQDTLMRLNCNNVVEGKFPSYIQPAVLMAN